MQCEICGIGFFLPSGTCDHCNTRRHTMTNTDDQRAAFEAWAKSRNAPIEITANVYHNVSVEFAWLAWQAAIEHAKKTMCNRN